ncbi:GerAB/ArcD/ProY family transporter [Caproiciproducens faecalis]|uniref:Endospore germination permease n=1 Tax=Caproiciproducens faecalis TaxID=2820301 RepID=A0ABS7DRB3_9FIRM|nr:endospore germination permease [Caproiciproducens faecalis]MBW7573836.1 endospore germination permease [Caproiciproducens faecalis]
MEKEYFTLRQIVCMIILFICGSSVVLGGSSEAGQDSWICLIMSQIFAIPMVMIYARIVQIYPEKNIFQVLEILFGKFAGKILTALFTWYSLHLAALVLRNFSEFIAITSIPETPQLALMIVMGLVCVHMAKSGIEVFVKWSLVNLAALLLLMFLTIFLLFNRIDVTNFLPIMEHDTKTLFAGSYSLFAFPFAETVLFLGITDHIRKEDKPLKVFLLGEGLGALIVLVVMLRNISVLGAAMLKTENFPSYSAARIINVSEFLARVEGVISTNFILGGITKISLCLITACKGTASLFNIKDYKTIVMPVALCSIALSLIIFSNTMQMFNFLNVYKIYAIPFQILIPALIWVWSEFKAHFKEKKADKPA